MKKMNLAGMRFGMLEVIKENPVRQKKKVMWSCRCDCGKVVSVSTSNLSAGKSTSCGCVRTKHSGKGSRLYRIWTGMKDRCHNPKSKYWKRYGDKGVFVCDEWRKDFAAFREWATTNGYKPNLTIDRVDNDGPYMPENCQWLTREENASKKDSPGVSREIEVING